MLKWTKEKPKEEGYYWFKTKKGINMCRVHKVTEKSFGCQLAGITTIFYINDLKGEWTGPIPEPMEDDE